MRLLSLRTAAAVILAFTTAACGGDGSYTAMIPAPTPAPTPTPTPTPAPPPGPAIPAAVQTASPVSPVAGTTKFSTLTQATDFPLLMTAAKGGTGDGDSTTTSLGGTIRANPDGTYTLTINNTALGINNVTVPSQSGIWNLRGASNSPTLDYTRYGYWSRDDGVDGVFNLSAWTTGFITPPSSIPIQGTAAYAGQAAGLINAAISPNTFADFDSSFTGNVSLTANFGASTLSGSITNITASSLYTALTGPVNDIGFTASINNASNLFSGTTSVTGQLAGPYAFGPTAAGLIDGRFYGPHAEEVGAVFNLTEGTRRLIGSFGAKK